jgi:hypothetical protein
VYVDFHAFVRSVRARFKGPRCIQTWLCTLACSTALALLASLLWFAPWQRRHDSPTTIPQSMPLQGSNHTTTKTARPVVAPASTVGSLPSVPVLQIPAQPPPSVTFEAPTEALDTQAMQGLVTRLETARSKTEEYLATSAMDRLLARLASADKTGSPSSPRSKMGRKRGTRVRPKAGGHGAPGSVSPLRTDTAPFSAASGMQFPDAAR